MKDDNEDYDVWENGFSLAGVGLVVFYLSIYLNSGVYPLWLRAMVMFIIALLLIFIASRIYNRLERARRRREKENRTTRELLQEALGIMSLWYEFAENHDFVVKYENETFTIQASDAYPTIRICDSRWYSAPLDDIDNLALLHRAINECNKTLKYVRLVYSIHPEENKIYVYGLCDILWVNSIPRSYSFLCAIFDCILYSHQYLLNKMEELRSKESEIDKVA